MAYELKKEAEIQNLGTIFYVSAPFDKSMELFKKEGLNLISARDLAYARIEDAKAIRAERVIALCARMVLG